MTVWVALALGAAGGIGAACRLVVDGMLRERLGTAYPLGTMTINITGSFLLGLVTGLAGSRLLPEEWFLILGTGLLGGYTTFSTASLETVRLARAGRHPAAVTNGIGMLVGAVVAAALGLWVGSLP